MNVREYYDLLTAQGEDVELAKERTPEDILDTPVVISKGLKNSAGKARWWKDGRMEVRLHQALLRGEPSDLKDTLIHEVAHLIVKRDDDGRHGRVWKGVCKWLGIVPSSHHSIGDIIEGLPVRAICLSCNYEIRRARPLKKWSRGRPVISYTHSCGGKLKLVEDE